MIDLSKLPKPLFIRIIFTPAIGIVLFFFSLSYFFLSHDHTLLMLSIILLGISGYKAFHFYQIISHEKYTVVEGTCVSIRKMFRKLKEVRIMDEDGVETAIKLPRNYKMVIGGKYKLYFSEKYDIRSGNDSIDTLFATDHFLGVEQED